MFLLTRGLVRGGWGGRAPLRVEQALKERGVRDRVGGRSLTVRALVGSRPPLGDVWHAASGASQTSLRSTLNFAQNQERGLAAGKILANVD